MSDADPEIPVHVGIIMDGNRRWARAHHLPIWGGHAEGQKVLRQITQKAFGLGIRYLSVYAFSTENWSRSNAEVGFLMRRVSRALRKYIGEFVEANVKIVFLGNRNGLPESVIESIEHAESRTAENTAATLAICFNYGGLQELTDAAKGVMTNNVKAEDLTPDILAKYLYEPQLPPIDLIIRTGGQQRLSNFMLWRAAYAELYFTDTLWPDFSESDLQTALREYASRHRRFGS